ncbi:hypothetical protein [Psychromicrobium xiongbiense]|uniref:hypothetical protein n=1 Tax=Psychromicrobium xiongbiense TaxID=3051184 RepID=UPI00255747A0|nr:hypothetical protein [Psychromicrobium sp. YIM S02556]
MKTPTTASVKTLGIQLEPELHAQLSMIAQLRGGNLKEEILQALAAHVETAKNSGTLQAQAEAAAAEIEREATARREALASLMGTTPETGDKPRTARSTR